MSPAKRLSRQRFRALCERCRMYGTGVAPRSVARRVLRHINDRARMNERRSLLWPYRDAWSTVDTLARLSR